MKSKKILEIVKELLGYIADTDEQLFVRIVRRHPISGTVTNAWHVPISYHKTINRVAGGYAQCLSVEESEMREVFLDGDSDLTKTNHPVKIIEE